MSDNYVITAISLLSPWGNSVTEFERTLLTHSDGSTHNPKTDIEDFDLKELFGKKAKHLNKITGMSLIAIRNILESSGIQNRYDNSDIGLCIGTNFGSYETTFKFTIDTFIQDKPYYVDPALFPQGILNYMAGRSAIEFDLRGVNATISGGYETGIELIEYGINALDTKQSSAVIIGAVEESNEYSQYVHTTLNSAKKHAEGCVFFLIEKEANVTDKKLVIGQIINTQVFYIPQLTEELFLLAFQQFCKDSQVELSDILTIVGYGITNDRMKKISRISKFNECVFLRLEDYIKETLCVTNLFQIIMANAVCRLKKQRGYSIIISSDLDGLIGFCLLKI